MDTMHEQIVVKVALFTVLYLIGEVCAVADSPFLTRAEALPILGREGLSRYSGLTAQLNLRADIDGWEEMLYEYKSAKPKAVQQLEVVLNRNLLSAEQRDLIIKKVLLGSAVGVHGLTRHSRTASVSLSDLNPFTFGGT